MYAEKLRSYREKRGLSQTALASSINLSLRTIQRLESGKTSPKGHTLLVVKKTLGLDVSSIRTENTQSSIINPIAIEHLKYINLSALCFLGIPFGNIIVPLLLLKRYKADPVVKKIGKKVINVQILWSISLMLVLILSPFMQFYFPFNFVLILWMGLMMAILNLVIILKIANSFNRHNFDVLNVKISLL